MEKDLLKFMENIEYKNKDISIYNDERGFYLIIGTASLLASVEYLELNEVQLKTAIYNQEVDKNLEYNKIKVERPRIKSEITRNEKDKDTIINAEEEVSQIWVIRNQLKLCKSYNNKEEAIKVAKEINEKVFKAMEV